MSARRVDFHCITIAHEHEPLRRAAASADPFARGGDVARARTGERVAKATCMKKSFVQSMRFVVVTTLVCTVTFAQPAAAQFEAAGFATFTNSGQFDETDVGFGGRASWYPPRLDVVSIEAELAHYPRDYPSGEAGSAFSSARWEAFFGGTVGPRFGRVRPFAKVRPGFLRYNDSPQPFACILIFPPPLACALADGATLTAVDVGGGLELALTDRSRFRFDIGDRLLRYEGPVRSIDGDVHEDAFWGHDLRVTVGVGFRLLR
jgi:hypothetical protein